jgi:hypothetical protein
MVSYQINILHFLYSMRIYYIFILGLAFVCAQLSAQNCDSAMILAVPPSATHLTCNQPIATMTAIPYPGTPIASYAWSGPNGFEASQAITTTTMPGTYAIVVTAANGCKDSATVFVQDLCLDNIAVGLLPFACDDMSQTPTFHPADDCQSVCISRCLGGVYYGSSSGWVANPAPPGWCSMIQNDHWLSFMALAPDMTITAAPINCANGDGIQMALYPDCGQSSPLACNPGGGGQGMVPVVINVSDLIPGKAYFIIIDGLSGDACDFALTVTPTGALDTLCNNPSLCLEPPCGLPDSLFGLEGAASLCPGGTGRFNFNAPQNFITSGYLWTGPPGTLINGQPAPALIYGPDGRSVDITIGAESGYVCMRTLTYFNEPSEPYCMEVGGGSPVTNLLPEAVVCPEALPYVTSWGQSVFVSGTYSTTLNSVTGCDSLVRQKVTVLPVITTVVTESLCSGCVTVCGEQFCLPGNYTVVCQSSTGCDSTIQLIVTSTGYEVNTLPEVVVCANDVPYTTPGGIKVSLSGVYADTLISLDGCHMIMQLPVRILPALESNIVASPCSCCVTVCGQQFITPGNYTIVCQNANGCDSIIHLTVLLDTPSNLTVSAVDQVINCIQPSAPLIATSNAYQPVYTWQQTLFGYEVTVTDGVTGCTATDAMTVSVDTDPPALMAAGTTINCFAYLFNISASSSTPGTVLVWYDSNGLFAEEPNPAVTSPGTYTVVATDTINGCTSTASVSVTSNIATTQLPVQQIPSACGDTTYTLIANANIPNVVVYWTGPNGFADTALVVVVEQAGAYTAYVNYTNHVCNDTTTVVVTPAPPIPDITASATPITCNQPAFLCAVSNVPSSTFTWSAPVGANTNCATTTIEGNYSVTVTTTAGCTATASVTVVDSCVISTSQPNNTGAASALKIFPVPSDGQVKVELFGEGWSGDVLHLRLIDATGRSVWHQSCYATSLRDPLLLSHLPDGAYVLSIQSKSRQATGRLVLLR